MPLGRGWTGLRRTKRVDLSKLEMDETLVESVVRGTEVLRREVVRIAANRKPVVLLSSINGRRCHMTKAFFDRLVDFRFVRPMEDHFNVTDIDRSLEIHGLVKIIEKPQELGYFLGDVVTSAVQLSVTVTEEGNAFIENVDPMELAYSFIRQGLFPWLERLMPMLGEEALPVFLVHWSSCVQEIALSCLEK